MGSAPLTPVPVAEALARASAAPRGLLALGMRFCAACMLLPASLAEIARARPDLVIAIGEFAGPEDWGQREELLWPRGIHVSRSLVPAMAVLVDGEVVASRQGAAPAEQIDRWLEEVLGPAAHPLPGCLTPRELEALEAVSGRIARQSGVKERRAHGLSAA